MKFKRIFLAMVMLVFVSFLSATMQAQPVTSGKYVKTAVDTFTYSGYATTLKGMITNEGDTDLYVYWSNAAGSKLTTSVIKIPKGKPLLFNCYTKKIFRLAVKDSVYSQIIIGDIQWGANLELKEGECLILPTSTVLVSNDYAYFKKPDLIRKYFSNAF